MSRLRMHVAAVVREPLLQFALAAFALFSIHALIADTPRDDGGTIVVDRRALLTYVQYRANAFQADYFSRRFDQLPPEERRRLAQEYARSEALYREAQALGLAEGDNVIRQRMIQKMQFLLGSSAADTDQPNDAALAAYLEAHAEEYVVAPALTFTHVFFDAETRGEQQARQAAASALVRLNAAAGGFNDAGGWGDPFPYFRHYVERTHEYVASHFGEAFVAALVELTPSAHAWHGPVASEHGVHLVMLADRRPKRLPRLEEVELRVAEDLQRERAAAALDTAVDDVLVRYRIEIANDVLPSANSR